MAQAARKTHLIKACQQRGDKFAPIYSVPTGTRLFWCADVEPETFPNAYANIRLRRGNELIDLIGPIDMTTVAGSTRELPMLSPGRYELAFDGFRLTNGTKTSLTSDAWSFQVKEPGSEIEGADAEAAKTYRFFV